MQTVESLIRELQKFPSNAICHAYEGEVTGVIVSTRDNRLGDLGYVPCSEADEQEGPAVINEPRQDVFSQPAPPSEPR